MRPMKTYSPIGPWRDLKPGDPWSFLIMDVLMSNDEKPRPLVVGDLMESWFDTGEPGRVFKLTAVHPVVSAGEPKASYETIFVGFDLLQKGGGGYSDPVYPLPRPNKPPPPIGEALLAEAVG